MGTEKEDLLRILEARGKQFMSSLNPSVQKHNDGRGEGKKRKIEDDESEEEWHGISTPRTEDSVDEEVDDTDGAESEASAHTGPRGPDVVFFSQSHETAGSSMSSMKSSKAQMKAFMSSKVTKLTQEVQEPEEGENASNEDDELTNAQNDALLHKLVHTRILSGSLNPDLDLTPAQRKKALAGRVLEAAGKAKLGKGETTVRAAEHNKAAKRVRVGMKEKQKERNEKELEEAKLLGNYHPTLKGLYDASSQSRGKKRERGMKMGVGSFRGGILKLSGEEIRSAEGGGSRGGRGGRGHGRGSHQRGGRGSHRRGTTR